MAKIFETTNKAVKKSEIRATRLTPDIARLSDKVAHTEGLTPAEYLRNLVVADLNERNVITSTLKRKLGLVWMKKEDLK